MVDIWSLGVVALEYMYLLPQETRIKGKSWCRLVEHRGEQQEGIEMDLVSNGMLRMNPRDRLQASDCLLEMRRLKLDVIRPTRYTTPTTGLTTGTLGTKRKLRAASSTEYLGQRRQNAATQIKGLNIRGKVIQRRRRQRTTESLTVNIPKSFPQIKRDRSNGPKTKSKRPRALVSNEHAGDQASQALNWSQMSGQDDRIDNPGDEEDMVEVASHHQSTTQISPASPLVHHQQDRYSWSTPSDDEVLQADTSNEFAPAIADLVPKLPVDQAASTQKYPTKV